MIESSQKVIGLTIAEKMDTFQPLHICDLKEVDMLITELNPRDERLLPYHQAGIQIL